MQNKNVNDRAHGTNLSGTNRAVVGHFSATRLRRAADTRTAGPLHQASFTRTDARALRRRNCTDERPFLRWLVGLRRDNGLPMFPPEGAPRPSGEESKR